MAAGPVLGPRLPPLTYALGKLRDLIQSVQDFFGRQQLEDTLSRRVLEQPPDRPQLLGGIGPPNHALQLGAPDPIVPDPVFLFLAHFPTAPALEEGHNLLSPARHQRARIGPECRRLIETLLDPRQGTPRPSAASEGTEQSLLD